MKLTIDDIRGIYTNSDPENVNKTYAEKLENIIIKRGKVVKKSLPQVEYLFTAGTNIYTEDAIYHNLSFDDETTYILGKDLTDGGKLELYRSGASSWHPVNIDLNNPSLGLVNALVEPSLNVTQNGWKHTNAHGTEHTIAQASLDESAMKVRFIDDKILFDFAFNHGGKSVSSIKFIGTSPVTFEIPVSYTQGTPSSNVVNTTAVEIEFKNSILDANGLTTNVLGLVGTAYYPIEGYIQIEYTDNVYANSNTISMNLYVLPEIEFRLHPDTIAEYGNQIEKWWDLHVSTTANTLTHNDTIANSSENIGMTPYVEKRTGNMFYYGVDYVKILISAKNVRGFKKLQYGANNNAPELNIDYTANSNPEIVETDGDIINYTYTLQVGRTSTYNFQERAESFVYELKGLFILQRYYDSTIGFTTPDIYRRISPYGTFNKTNFASNDHWRFQYNAFPYATYLTSDEETPDLFNEETLSEDYDFDLALSRENKPYKITGVFVPDNGGNNVFQLNGQEFYQYKLIDEPNDIRVYIIFPKNLIDNGQLIRFEQLSTNAINETNQGLGTGAFWQSHSMLEGYFLTIYLGEGYEGLARPAIYNDFDNNTIVHTASTQKKRFTLGDWYARSQDETEFANWWNNGKYLVVPQTHSIVNACSAPTSLPSLGTHGMQYFNWKLNIFGSPHCDVFLMGHPYNEMNLYLGRYPEQSNGPFCAWRTFSLAWDLVDSVNTWTIRLKPIFGYETIYQEMFVQITFNTEINVTNEPNFGANIFFNLELQANTATTFGTTPANYQALLASDDNNGGSFDGDAGNNTAIDLTQNLPPNNNTN